MTVAEVTAAPEPVAPARPTSRWRRWRKSRPFWGGLITILAGIEVTLIPIPAYKIVFVSPSLTYAIVSGMVVLILGLAVWMTPQHSRLYGMLIILAAVLTFVWSNLGGFFIGGLLGVLGGALVFAWDPPLEPAPGRGRRSADAQAVVSTGEAVHVPLVDLMDSGAPPAEPAQLTAAPPVPAAREGQTTEFAAAPPAESAVEIPAPLHVDPPTTPESGAKPGEVGRA